MDKIFVDEAVNELHTIQDMLRWSVSRFSAANIWYGHGTDNPWDEAVQLVLPSLYLPLDIPEDMRTARLTSSEKHRIVERVIRRVNERIPVAYLTNKAWFCGHEFYVDERVLVPRSPIGELINNHFEGLIGHQPQHILDMCTGSGCIAVTLARLIPGARVTAVDISEKALSIARENARRLDAEVDFRQGDALGELFPGQREQFDLIVSNPPYIPRREKASMRVNVTGYEPAEALFVEDDDPLIFYRAIARNARRLLRPGGRLYFEIHENFADETLRMLTREGFPDTAVRRDLNDKNRMTCSLQRR